MKLFLDSALIDEVREAAGWGIVDGVTTNPSLIKKSGRDFKEVINEICEVLSNGAISAEVLSEDAEGMLKEAREFASWKPNIVIKIPMTDEGLKAVKVLSEEGIHTNVTLMFSANQALLAAKAGATYVSPFVGRLDDNGQDGMQLISDIVQMYMNYGFDTEIIVASVRHPMHVHESAMLGAHVATVPFGILEKMFGHPLTDSGIEKFMKDAGVR
ncbi:fructose-6-phosphate aldolase [Candidatus Peregrinibacteria bacterium]|jgi:transaldolase|nr:fructose-6-phosphate aldolase [Candidatus Peregrinibacteria bacterium]MBT4147997.1 fructose-6-phosphate aldolase [Candidatus Peregrinibacteria bacterium]MBT4366096.1 fructose-6-phosphate aldolase [Candidatus Peregrinibacteria bacterium]MBT4456246.1 fructose-6-phosphate aldolase [Candidatus Peregrinibacteria bacterium]